MALLLPVIESAAHEPERLRSNEVTIEQRLDDQLPLDLGLVDESGREVALRRFFGIKPVLLAFVYYECPQLCPLVLDGLVRSLRVLSLSNQQYEVLVVSIDPQEPHTLAARKKQHYLARFSQNSSAAGWHFLTGPAPSIERLTHAAGLRYTKERRNEKNEYIHPAITLVLTPGGKISRYLYGFDLPPKDLRFALIEASENRIGSALDHLLLLCYQYDPAKGKYTLAVLNILRLSGIATVLSMGAFLTLMLRRERAKRPLRGLP
jgi:protein SCO1/2